MARASDDIGDAPAIRIDAAESAASTPSARSAANSFASSDAGGSQRLASAETPAAPFTLARAELLARQAALAAEIESLQPRTPKGMLNPNDPRKLAWDWLVLCFVVYTTLATPLDLAFFDTGCRQAPPAWQFAALTRACLGDTSDAAAVAAYEAHQFGIRPACKPAALEVLDYVVDIIFGLDILLTFCTGLTLEKEGAVEYRRGVVARRYISHGLVLDVLSALPLEALGHAITGDAGSGTAMALKLLRLPRLLHMSRLLRKLEQAASATLFRVGLLVGAYVLIGHWAACTFFYLSKWQLWHSATGWASSGAGLHPWAVTQCVQWASTPTRYTIALYWALTTMATVGFGDVVPGTNMERCFAMALQLVAGVLQGVVFGNIGVAMAGFDRGATAVKARVVEAAALVHAAGLPQPLARRLATAARAQAEAQRDLAEGDALRGMAGGLLVEAEDATAGARALAATSLFRDARPPLPRRFAAAVARRMRVQAVPPGELAACEGDADAAACLLLRGVAVRAAPAAPASPDSPHAPMWLTAGSLFGDADAVLCRRTAADVFAAQPVTLLTISRAGLDAALDECPDALGPLLTASMARESREAAADEQAAHTAAQLVLQRSSSRRTGRSGAGSGSGGGSAGGAVLDASAPIMASRRTAGLGHAAACRGSSGGESSVSDAAPAAARWGKAGTAARMVVRLAGGAGHAQHERDAAAAALSPRQEARAAAPEDALLDADWSGFNARLRALVDAQAASFHTCASRLDAVLSRHDASMASAAPVLL